MPKLKLYSTRKKTGISGNLCRSRFVSSLLRNHSWDNPLTARTSEKLLLLNQKVFKHILKQLRFTSRKITNVNHFTQLPPKFTPRSDRLQASAGYRTGQKRLNSVGFVPFHLGFRFVYFSLAFNYFRPVIKSPTILCLFASRGIQIRATTWRQSNQVFVSRSLVEQ